MVIRKIRLDCEIDGFHTKVESNMMARAMRSSGILEIESRASV